MKKIILLMVVALAFCVLDIAHERWGNGNVPEINLMIV